MRYTIGLREANHHLATHIKAVEEGHEVIITRRSRPVARLTADVGMTPPIDRTRHPAAWQAAYERMLNLMGTAPVMGGERDWTRDEIYDR